MHPVSDPPIITTITQVSADAVNKKESHQQNPVGPITNISHQGISAATRSAKITRLSPTCD